MNPFPSYVITKNLYLNLYSYSHVFLHVNTVVLTHIEIIFHLKCKQEAVTIHYLLVILSLFKELPGIYSPSRKKPSYISYFFKQLALSMKELILVQCFHNRTKCCRNYWWCRTLSGAPSMMPELFSRCNFWRNSSKRNPFDAALDNNMEQIKWSRRNVASSTNDWISLISMQLSADHEKYISMH